MNNSSILPSNLQERLRPRSMGVKLIFVCVLALFMVIPSFFVMDLVNDRTRSARNVTKEISSHVGGPQTFLGPTLAIPYIVPSHIPSEAPKRGIYLVSPAQGSAVVKTTTEERRRSLFRVPVFQADLKFDAAFDLKGVPAAAPPGVELDWSLAEIIVGASDPIGALADATMTTDNNKTAILTPAQVAQSFTIGGDENHPDKLVLFGAKAGDVARPDTAFHATSTLRFSGAERIAVLAYGKTTRLTAQGDWRDPGFGGGILPVSRTISGSGYTAEWTVPFIARGVRAEGPSDLFAGLDATALAVSFVEVADPYQSVSRSLKYVPLFLGLVFLTYFVFETTTGKRVHPAQYILVGIAQIIFYLLLLSVSERIGFGLGFLIAGAATVILLSTNAAWIFSSRLQGIRALFVFTLLYLFIYTLLRLEDNALLVGAVASFLTLAAVMYFTRTIDWYSSLPGADVTQQPAMPPPPPRTA